VNLLTGRAHRLGTGGAVEISEPPAEHADAIAAARLAMIEAVAEADDTLLEKYLGDGELSEAEIFATLRKGVRDDTLLPLLCAAASRNIGGMALMLAAENIFPSAAEAPPRKAHQDEAEVELAANPGAHVAALVWKTVADRYAGQLSVLRVFSGTLKKDMTVLNARTGARERVGKLLRLHGEQTEEVTAILPGQIAAIPKLKDTHTGDTLCDEKHPILLERMQFANPVISQAIEPRTKADQDKIGQALARLAVEDPTFRVHTDDETGQCIISGMGELHLEIIVDRMKREFKVEANVGKPQVAYRETITKRVDEQYIHKKQTGGSGQFAEVWITFEPLERSAGFEFVDKTVGGSVPKEFVPAVEKGLKIQKEDGVLAKYPTVDFRATLTDGSYHDVDSNALTFEIAAKAAFREGIRKAGPILLEPVMKVETVTPGDYLGDVIGDINRRRGMIQDQLERGANIAVVATVPLSEMFGYIGQLRGMTSGRASYTMEFSHYEPVPKSVADEVIAAVTEAKAAANA
jgi:elongation factor G